MKSIKLTWEQVFPKGAILVGIRPWFDFKDGKRTDTQLGLNYSVVNRLGYDKVSIKVANSVPLIKDEEIEAAEEDLLVKAEGFEGTIYNYNGSIAISGKADKVILL